MAGLVALGQTSIRPGRIAPFPSHLSSFSPETEITMKKIRQGDYRMAAMSAARIRSLYCRRNQAYEAVYHFSANSVGHSIAGFSATQTTETSPVPSADERFRDAVRREIAKAGLA